MLDSLLEHPATVVLRTSPEVLAGATSLGAIQFWVVEPASAVSLSGEECAAVVTVWCPKCWQALLQSAYNGVVKGSNPFVPTIWGM